jgi:hypothetical protein
MYWVVTWDALMQLLLLHVRFTAEKEGMLEEVILYIVSAIGLTLIEIRPSANFATRGNTIGSVPPVL